MAEHLLEITDTVKDRYASLKLISWWNQKRLRGSRVMVVGLGALGNEVLKNLALLGIGQIFIVDFDEVEASNLSRSILFRLSDSGRRKVEVAAEKVREINPDVSIRSFYGDVTCDLGTGIYRRMDVVLCCVDNRAARLAVNRACWRVGTPWIDGALDILMGMVRIFTPPRGACYECTMTEQDYQQLNLHYSCSLVQPEDLALARIPTTPTDASIIGALQVQEAIKFLHGQEVPAGKGIYFNGQTYRTSLISYPTDEECSSHVTYGNIIELPHGVDDLTVGAFLDLVSSHGGNVRLMTEQEILQKCYCPQCKKIEDIYRPYRAVVNDKIKCPTCGNERIPTVTTSLVQDSYIAGIPLKQMGIPPLHILQVEYSDGYLYFELTGDSNILLKDWNEKKQNANLNDYK